MAVLLRNTKILIFFGLSEGCVYLILFYVTVVLRNTKIPDSLVKANNINIIKKPLNRNESRRFGALISDSTHHFLRNACTKSGSLRFSQFSGCWLILSVYIIMSFDFPFVRLFGVRSFCYYPYWFIWGFCVSNIFLRGSCSKKY